MRHQAVAVGRGALTNQATDAGVKGPNAKGNPTQCTTVEGSSESKQLNLVCNARPLPELGEPGYKIGKLTQPTLLLAQSFRRIKSVSVGFGSILRPLCHR